MVTHRRASYGIKGLQGTLLANFEVSVGRICTSQKIIKMYTIHPIMSNSGYCNKNCLPILYWPIRSIE